MFGAQEADAVFHDFQDAAAQFQPLLFGIGPQQAHDQVFLFHSRAGGDFEFLARAAQIDEGHFFEFGYVHGWISHFWVGKYGQKRVTG